MPIKLLPTKNNLILNENDEILATNNIQDSDSSSLNSYLPRNRRVGKSQYRTSRANNAKKFLEQVEKAKKEVINKRITQSHWKVNKKTKETKYKIMEDKTENELSTGAEGKSEINLEDSFWEAKNLKEKYLKEIRKQKKLNKTNNIPQSDPKLIKAKSITRARKLKTTRNKNFNIDYEDLNRKDNFIFFEVLATYADAYLSEDERNPKNLKKFVNVAHN